MQQQPQQQAKYHSHNIQEDMYKGIVIEGLPELITNDDENIRKLDSAVINALRKYLKQFLKEDIKLDKKAMKAVSIIPHTATTERSVEHHNNAQYIHVGGDSTSTH